VRLLRTLGLATLAAAALAGAVDAQPAKPLRIAYLAPGPNDFGRETFLRELARLGYVEGHNLTIIARHANGQFDRLPAMAVELVKLEPDVIVTVVTQPSLAAKQATSTIPIVMLGVGDPVGAGLVASLARPGGNVTGASLFAVAIIGKQMELLREVVPGLSRIAVLYNPANLMYQKLQLEEAQAVAKRMGMSLELFKAARPEALASAFDAIARARPGAVLLTGDPMFTSAGQRIAELAIERRLPTASGLAQLAEIGVLMTYGPSYPDAGRRAANYVDRIVKGAKPGELAVDQPRTFELIVNARTAAAIGVKLPPALEQRADRVIR
jgi:putative ABC transport system substrate-binding protein